MCMCLFTLTLTHEHAKKVYWPISSQQTSCLVNNLHNYNNSNISVWTYDRTIGFYNIQDNAVLETTSNPLWAATIYYRLREVERDGANRADDPRAARGLEQSLIQKFMALGILFNGGNK